jgi:uncharacterized membrane protein YbhN (UPF0104 family)
MYFNAIDLCCIGVLALLFLSPFYFFLREFGGDLKWMARRFWRQPRFGLWTIMLGMAIVSVTLACIRWALRDTRDVAVVPFAMAIGGVAAIGIVLFADFMLDELREVFRRRSARRRETPVKIDLDRFAPNDSPDADVPDP